MTRWGVIARAATDEPEVLRFWSSFAGGEPKVALDRLVDEFNRAHGALGRIEKYDMATPQIEQKLLTAIAGGVSPDLVLLNRCNIASFAIRGALEPWDAELPALGLKGEDFHSFCWREGCWEGRAYGLPFNTDVRVLFINRRLVREAGLDPDQPPRTWDDLRAWNRKLTRRGPDGRLTQVGFVPLGGAFGNTYPMLYIFQKGDAIGDGTGALRVNGPQARAAMEWVLETSREYDIGRLLMLQTAGGADQLSLFMREKMALTGDEGYLLSLIRRYAPQLDILVAPLPYPTGGQPATWSGGFALVRPQGCPLTPLGAAFVQFLLSRPVQLDYGKQADQIPALRAAAQDPYFLNDPHWRVFIAELEHSRSLPISPLSLKLFFEMLKVQERILLGKATPAAALDQLQAELDKEWRGLTAGTYQPLVAGTTLVGIVAGLLLLGLLVRATAAVRHVRRMRLRRREALWGYLLALPAILGLLLFSLGPMLYSLLLSFCRYDVLTPARWIGLENYRTMFTADPLLIKALFNTAFFTVAAVVSGVALSLALALLLNRPLVGRPLWRTVFYLPSIFPAVGGSFLWLWLFNGEYGLLNVMLTSIGLPAIPWLTSPAWAKPALVLMSLWGVGGSVLILLAALQGVPQHLFEAAMLDGATPWQRFRHITVPMVSPALFFVTVMGTIGAFQVFTQAFLVTAGGPADSTLFYVLYLFQRTFQEFHMGYGAALAWVLLVIIATLTALQFRLGRRWVNHDAV